ncbi:hypothetical protein [Streptomyces sp. NPDC126503]|uniref:hypothetical protein n=1 Tax=Streptomyces sp. NPDC126503 TaxID=3155315 RepID=UPI00331F000F
MTARTEVTPADAQEIEASGHYITVALGETDVEVVPAGAWRQSAMRKLRIGDMDAFLEAVLSPASYELYLELDPTNDDLNTFIEDVSASSGESVGKSSGRPASSRSTRKR